METLHRLIEKLRQEMNDIFQKEGNLGDEKLLLKSREMDELLNIFYDPGACGMSRDGRVAAGGEATIDAITAALKRKGLVDENLLDQMRKQGSEFGKVIGLSALQHDSLDLLTRMHNLGKLFIPAQVLSRKRPLTEQELHILREHPEKAHRIALCLKELTGIAKLLLLHREHWDGGGYPRGLAGEAIPLECRIFAVVEAYCTMVRDRPRLRDPGIKEILAELKRYAGRRLDPGLVRIFCEMRLPGG